MRKLIAATGLLTSLAACHSKPDSEKLSANDMTGRCKTHIVLNNPTNNSTFVFIDRKRTIERFIILKNFNENGSGYGYMYCYSSDKEEAFKNGIYNTLDQAVDAAHKNLPNQINWILASVRPIGDGQWTIDNNLFDQVCPDEPGFQRNTENNQTH